MTAFVNVDHTYLHINYRMQDETLLHLLLVKKVDY